MNHSWNHDPFQGGGPVPHRPKKQRKPIGTPLGRTLLNLAVTLIFGAVYFYIVLPPLNLHSGEFYVFVLLLCAVYCGCAILTSGFQGSGAKGYFGFVKKQCTVPFVLAAALAVTAIVGTAVGWEVFRAGSYRDLLTVDNGDFAAEVEEISYDQIPMLDKDSAEKLGNRKLGELSDMVSQFEVAEEYTQINYKGRPVRVYALEGSNRKDDFYAAVNREWLTASTIPAGYAYSGALYDLGYEVTGQVSEIIREIAASAPKEGTPEEKIKNLYENILDWDARNKAGITPIKPYLDAIGRAESLDALMKVHNDVSSQLGASLALGFGLTVDQKDSGKYILTFGSLSPSLGKEDYAAGAGIKDAYLQYLTTLLTLGGEDAAKAAKDAQAYYQVEQDLAGAMMDRQEYGDVDKTYNLYTMQALQALFPNVDLDAVREAEGLSEGEAVMVQDVALLETAAAYFDETHLETLKTIMKLYLLGSFGSALDRAFTDASDRLQQAMYGTDTSLPDEDLAAQLVQAYLADYLGEVYVERYFSAEAKADVEAMIEQFRGIYKERILALDWMSAATKEKAVEKLNAITVNVGYPDRWDTYLDDAQIRSAAQGGSYFENLVSITLASRAEAVALQDQPVDKTAWQMSPYTVNAYYDATSNSINFPAGILQAPLYDVQADPTENLGGIGYIIAHEMTHAFDNNGAKFDKNGNAADWWTEEDYAAFRQLCQRVVAFYDGVEVIPGVTCNGNLTLSENIADLGALACITQAEGKEKQPDYPTLYESAARTWTFTGTREIYAYLAQLDVHAPGKLRGNRALQAFDEFYAAFDIQSGDGMWLEPEQRVQVW